jgi:hypothetical protein
MDVKTEKPRRIAVIAIHGVADQKPDETARAAANMLLRAKVVEPTVEPRKVEGHGGEVQRPAGTYQGFLESELLIPVRAVRTKDAEELSRFGLESEGVASGAHPSQSMFAMQQQSQTAANPREAVAREEHRASRNGFGSGVGADETPTADRISLAYMHEQLEHCVVPQSEAIYETIRLETVRTDLGAHVHVFEMYWADLSRPVGSWFRWLIEFYQLLFSLCVLGRKSLEFALAEYEFEPKASKWGARLWGWFSWAQMIAETALAVFVPVLNLCLLALAFALLPLMAPPEVLRNALVAVLFALSAGALGYGAYRWRATIVRNGRRWPVWLIPTIMVGGAAAALWHSRVPSAVTLPAAVHLSYAAASLGILKVLWWYQKSRPGALPFGALAVVAVSICYLIEVAFAGRDPAALSNGLVRTAQITTFLLTLSWSAVLLCTTAASVLGQLVVMAVPDQETPERTKLAQKKARRAAWTANVTLVVPALVVLLVNLTLWYVLIRSAVPGGTQSSTADHFQGAKWNFVSQSAIWQQPFTSWASKYPKVGDWGADFLLPDPTASPKLRDAAYGLMAKSHTPFYFTLCVVVGVAALILIWSIVPAVIGEVRPDYRARSAQHRDDISRWLGDSLSSGFKAMRLSGEFVRAIVLIWFPVGVVLSSLDPQDRRDLAGDPFLAVNEAFLWAGAAFVVAGIASRGPFKGLALGLRSGLDVALDVVNWLRLHPVTANPRGRICARYYSLLRHVQDWVDPRDGGQYDSIVILAHSQGTIITADLLRYLQKHQMSLQPSVYFFTMGCPLRQLYSLRFPHLYGWAHHGDRKWAGREPLPEVIDVDLWVNAYRSGDYVGRYLWHDEEGQGLWATGVVHADGNKREFCIGAGAHTHYWDESAPEIALELDRLVGLAAREGKRRGKPTTASELASPTRLSS